MKLVKIMVKYSLQQFLTGQQGHQTAQDSLNDVCTECTAEPSKACSQEHGGQGHCVTEKAHWGYETTCFLGILSQNFTCTRFKTVAD